MSRSIQVVFDCADPGALAAFWATALGYEIQPPPDGFDSWEGALTAWGIPAEYWNDRSAITDPDDTGPRVFFQRVPEPKSVKNRVHLDVNASGGPSVDPATRRARVAEEVGRLGSAGATVFREFDERDEHWVVMQDPEGNEFCVQ